MNLRDEIMAKIKSSPKFGDLRDIVIRFKDAGGQQEEAKTVLMGCLVSVKDSSMGEEAEDLLCDLLDDVVGWCSPHNRIWITPDRNASD